MAGRKEDTTPYLTNTQSCSWMPSTPAKPHFSTRQLICDNWQENHLVQANGLITQRLTEANQVNQPNCTESERLQMKYLQKMQCHSVPACPDWTNFNNSGGRCEAANSLVHRDGLCNSYTWQAGDATVSHLCVDDVSNFNFCQPKNAVNCRFCGKDLDVTAGTNAAENAVSQNDFSTTRKSVSHFYPQTEDNYSKTSTGKTLAGAVDSFLGTKFMDKVNSTPDALMDETSIPSQILFYLNSPAITTKDAATVNSSSSQLKPITPEKTNKLESMQENDMLCLNKNEVFMEKDSQDNKITTAEAGRVRKKVTHSKSIADKFCATTSTQLEENHNHDKVGNKEADLTKTPQQKPRRRKHRPKVVIEGRAKSTSNRNKKRPVAPQKTRIVRKKSVQRKGLIITKVIPSEGESSGTDSSDEVPSCKDTPVRKRKYGRTKGTDKPEPKMLSGTHSYTGRSCKRSLNFNMQCPVRDESSSCRSSANSETELGPEMEVVAKENHIGAYELTSYEDHMQAEYLPRPKKQFPSPWPHENMDSMEDHMNMKPNICTRGMCKTVFPNETLEKEKITEKATPNPTVCWTPKSPSNSNISRICVTHERQIGGLKRQYMDSEEGITGMHFPEICKKKRTEKRHYRTTTSLRYSMTSSDNHIFKCLLALGSSKWIKKKRSKGPTRLRKVASLISLCQELPASSNDDAPRYREDHNIGSTKEKSSCVEALKSDICSTMTKKKRSKQNMLINSTATNTYNQQHLSSKANRPLLPITWKRISPIDSFVEKLNQLDLKAETIQKTTQKQNVFMVLNYKHEESHALVPYQRGGPVVPFDSLFDQDRSRQPRPKVDLDDETIRVWKLLLEDITNGGIDGVDGENRKWWEEERKIFSGRADSFIARMHLIQGDRRFSPWKGSVIDSVIGVFLTQNVSDHLSSSAFMSLAAHFPFKKANLAELYGETIDIVAKEPAGDLDPEEIFMLDKTSLNKPICGEDPKILQDFECDDIKKVNILRPYANNFDDIIPGEDSRGQFSETSTIDPFVSNESVTIKSMNLIGEQRELADAFSSQSSVISSQSSADSPIAETGDRTESYLSSISKEEPTIEVKPHRLSSTTSFVKLLLMAGTILQGKSEKGCEEKISDENGQMQSNRLTLNLQNEHQLAAAKPIMSFDSTSSCMRERQELEWLDLSHENIKSTDNRSSRFSAAEASGVSEEFAPRTTFKEPAAVSFKAKRKLFSLNNQTSNNCQPNKNQNIVEALAGLEPIQNKFEENKKKFQGQSGITICQQNLTDVKGGSSKMSDRKEAKSSTSDPDYRPSKLVNQQKTKKGRTGKEKQNSIDWDELRKQAQERGNTWEKTNDTMDSVDWDAVRCSEVDEIARIIKDRGMNNVLAQRIKDFLNRLVRDHESTDLEWLRDIPPDKAKEFLLSIRGLGLKSVECVRLLTLHQLAFPVDTNVGRIAVRLGWVPLQPLPESLQLHLLELYPVLESIQKYLWPRLCKLDQRTLYELHYQMITFGKVFCTKNKPNCNACPMRGECRHFASAFASARLSLQAPEEKRIMSATENKTIDQKTARGMYTLQFPSPNITTTFAELEVGNTQPIVEEPTTPEPIIEAPVTPELDYTQVPEFDIENTFQDDLGEIPTIQLNIEEFNHNLQKIMQQHTEVQEEDRSKALVALNPEAASIPFPQLKNVSQLRTEHQVYELPDSHPLLEGMDKREQDDPSPYLLAIWTPGETLDSIEPPKRRCSSQESKKLCTEETCLSCNTIREAGSQTVRGTLLIPCRTAMRGSFPLNGTYFQVNEVFSDHESSLDPMDVPRKWLWNMPRRTVYFGTSIPTIFKGLSTEGIQRCFWRGFVCVRGFDRTTRAPRPLIARLHFPASKLVRRKGKIDEN